MHRGQRDSKSASDKPCVLLCAKKTPDAKPHGAWAAGRDDNASVLRR